MSSQMHLVASAPLCNVWLHLYFGNTLNLPADALVISSNDKLENEDIISERIAREAGEEIIQESKQWLRDNGRVVPGMAASTGSGELKKKGFKCIIHAVGPEGRASYENQDMLMSYTSLISTLVNSIKEASIQQCTSINIPGISCGISGFPKDVSAKCHFEAFLIFASQTSDFPNIKTVNFCISTLEEVNIFALEFLAQSNKFGFIEYYGTPEEQGLGIFNSFCKVCKNAFPLENFTISFNCCKGMCDFCFSRSFPMIICFACNTPLQYNPQYN